MSNAPADLHLASIGWTKSVAFAARWPKSAAKKNIQGRRSSSHSAYSGLINEFGEEEDLEEEIKSSKYVKLTQEEREEELKIKNLPVTKKKQGLLSGLTLKEFEERAAVQEARAHRSEAFEMLSQYLSKLPPGSLVVEISSRSGLDITDLVHKFPGLQFQPTEGSSGTAHGHFLFIEQNVLVCEDVIQQQKKAQSTRLPSKESRRSSKESRLSIKASQDANPVTTQEEARCLKPRVLDLKRPLSWGLDHIDNLGCIFCVDALQYEPAEAITEFLTTCSRILHRGGFVFFSGPFITDGHASDANFSLNVALKHYVAKAFEDADARRLPWGLPDSAFICNLAESLGMECHQHKVGQEWLALILRKPL